MRSWLLCAVTLLFAIVCLAAEADRSLSPVAARKKVGQAVTVEMMVRSAKNRLEQRGEIYLDSEENFRDEENFAVVITRAGAAKYKETGVEDPAEHFRGKTIRATGTVKVVQDVPRIEVDNPAQVKVVTPK